MLNAIRRESTADSDATHDIQQQRRLIEEKLAQLAQTERWHRELIQRYHLRQRVLANANAISKHERKNEKEPITGKLFFYIFINYLLYFF